MVKSIGKSMQKTSISAVNSPGHQWRRVGPLSIWRKFSLVLWANPVEAVRILPETELDVSLAAKALEKRKRDARAEPLTWTAILLRAIARVLAEHPEWNRFVRKNTVYARTNVDALLRVNLEDGSLWACYVRGAQAKSATELRRHIEAHRAKIRDRKSRYPALTTITDRLPVSLLRAAYRFYDWWENRTGLALPGLPDIRYPSFSVSNLGSIGSVLLPPLITRGLHCPIHLTMGAVEREDGKSYLPVIFGFDHRITDAAAVGEFFRALEGELANPSFIAEILP